VKGSPVLKPYTWAYCKSSVSVDRWGIIEITGVEITPTESTGGATASFEDMPVLTGGTPSATTTSWCVAVEPIQSGKIGRVAVAGVVQCKAADLGKASGAHVLWKNSSWALIRIQAGVIRGTFTAPWDKGSTATVTDAVFSSVTYTAKNYFTPITGTGSKDCAISFVGGEWILLDFDLTQLDGFDINKTQVLGAVSGALKWLNTTACT
jgi:hypothetical protein